MTIGGTCAAALLAACSSGPGVQQPLFPNVSKPTASSSAPVGIVPPTPVSTDFVPSTPDPSAELPAPTLPSSVMNVPVGSVFQLPVTGLTETDMATIRLSEYGIISPPQNTKDGQFFGDFVPFAPIYHADKPGKVTAVVTVTRDGLTADVQSFTVVVGPAAPEQPTPSPSAVTPAPSPEATPSPAAQKKN